MNRPDASEVKLIHRAVARLRTAIMALVFASLGATGLFVATVWLLIRGGPKVGPHLALLGNYFPGYTVTWGGAFLGLVYGAVLGAAIGGSVAWIYNRVADRHLGSVSSAGDPKTSSGKTGAG